MDDVGELLARHQALAGDPLMRRLRREYHARQEAEEAAERESEIRRLSASQDRSAGPARWTPPVREITRYFDTPARVTSY
jgi:hypothetical protein